VVAIAITIATLAPMRVARADDDATVDATTDVTEAPAVDSEAPDSSALVDAGSPTAIGDASKLEAAADAQPGYDAGSGLTPLDELPTWGEGADHNGCSCRLANGPRNATAAALPSILAIIGWVRSRRRRR
jgi:hypothetical protein